MSNSFRPSIVWLDGYHLSTEVDRSITALSDWAETFEDLPPVLVQETNLVRVIDGRIEQLGDHALRDMLAQAARFGVPDQNSTPTNPILKPRYPPLDIVKVILTRDARQFGLHEIRSVTTVPIFDQSGRLISTPGLHASGIWYEPEINGVEQFVTSDINDVDEIIAARDLLMTDLLGEFDFQDDASRANALALTLLPFMRELLGDAATPLHAIIAPQPGSGKTTLAKTCLAPGLGALEASTEPHDEDELRKKITSVLRKGRPSILFDNLNQELASGTLAAALTTTRWSDRILGESNDVVLDNRLIWVATGNNIGTTTELRDRVCPIWLIPKDGIAARHRSDDSYRHPEIVEWALANRARLAGACITLIMHWLGGKARMLPDGTFVREESRRRGVQTMGSFNVWAHAMGAVLEEADVHGFLTNRHTLDVIDIEEDEVVLFFSALVDKFGDDEFTANDLSSLCQFGGPLHTKVPNAVGSLRENPGHRLGKWFGKHRDSTHGTYRLRGRKGHRGAWVWRLESMV